jgi:hypothetical protein
MLWAVVLLAAAVDDAVGGRGTARGRRRWCC